jgi:hypothetical protein
VLVLDALAASCLVALLGEGRRGSIGVDKGWQIKSARVERTVASYVTENKDVLTDPV